MAVRKIPQRKCVACNTTRDKRDLIRIVKSPEGEISVDPTGKKPGRGAYICRDPRCLALARKGKKLEKVFETKISDEVWARLAVEMEGHD